MTPFATTEPTQPVAAAPPSARAARPQAPNVYPRRVLLAVTGLSPQVITETLYGLTQLSEPAFVPTEVQILTASAGACHARLMLLDSDGGRFRTFCSEYRIDPDNIDSTDASVRVMTDAHGGPIPPARLALLAVFARRARAGNEPLAAPSNGVPDCNWAELFMAEYRVIRGDMADTEQTERALRDGMCGDYFSSVLSYLRRDLKQALGAAAAPYPIDDGGRRPRRYRLALTPHAVRFTTLGAATDAGH